MTRDTLIRKYLKRQEGSMDEIQERLHSLDNKYNPDGYMLLECKMMDSSSMGELTILPYGLNNTHKTVPAYPISPKGLASDMSVVIGTCENKKEKS